MRSPERRRHVTPQHEYAETIRELATVWHGELMTPELRRRVILAKALTASKQVRAALQKELAL